MDILTGSVERITFYNPENGYCVLRLKADRGEGIYIGRDGLITVTGNMPELTPGESLQLQGRWLNHPKHGWQFQAENYTQIAPATIMGIQRYLGSGLVRGIGPRLAENIVNHFKLQTLEIIEHQPKRLEEVPDIGPKRAGLISRAWEEQKHVKEIMLFLHSYGVSTNLAVKIFKHYGDQAIGIVQTDPYRLAEDIFGVGFKTADKIAQALGLPCDHPSRIEAGLIYALNAITEDGHIFAPGYFLVERAIHLLEIGSDTIYPVLASLVEQGRLYQEDMPFIAQGSSTLEYTESSETPPAISPQSAYYLMPLFRSEVGVAKSLLSLTNALPSRLSDLPPAFVSIDPQLTQEQKNAIRTTLDSPVSVLTGGPGTGKTTCLKALITILDQAGKRYALASPTGRAAKRLSEATGKTASTIHRLLGYSPGEGFKYDGDHPLDIDLLVVDEASMLDIVLAHHLLLALKPGTHLLLVGDADQLPSVGAGDVLRDLINAQIVPVTRLSVIFRQVSGSLIIANAHKINQGKMPDFPKENQDFFLFPAEKPEEAAQWVQEVVCERMPRKFGFHPRDQIQVLAPMYRGQAGVHALNARLQGLLNPAKTAKPEKLLYGQLYRSGDKVMQVKNNYEKDVYNGDIGHIYTLDAVEQSLVIEFEGRKVLYDWSEADQLVLAYAISVHKAQGSEFPAVVMPFLTAHYMMLQRNLLYTAVTRAKQICVLVGNRRAIGIALKNNKVAERYTALEYRLRLHEL